MDLRSAKHMKGLRDCCTACAACLNICPANAISLQPDEEGFLQPFIDDEKCSNCDLCKNVCETQKSQNKNSNAPECYAVWAEDSIRKVSSSGGVFTLLAEYVFDKGGYVCGAAFGENWKVEHILIDDKNELAKLRGSKYVQSEIGYIYNDVKKLLDAGKHVLFSGCPCQVAGLYAFLGKEYDCLITVDLVCHGVPSYTIFKKWLDEEFSGKDVESINFRDKAVNGWCCTTTTTLTDGSRINNQDFFKGFDKNLYLRKSCTTCRFATTPRQGDITLADFWEIHLYDTSLDDRKGTSMVLINNQNGRRVLDEIRYKTKRIEKVPFEFALSTLNVCLYKPWPVHPARERFFKLIKNSSFKKSLDYALHDKYDIGIVGLGYGDNYGAILTNYAIYEYLKSLDLIPLMIDKPRDMRNGYYSDYEYLNTTAREFMNKYLVVSRIYENKDDIKELNSKCNMFLLGSDQVWNHYLYNPVDYFVFLDFARDDKKKIAYASSFGNDDWYGPEHERARASYLMSKFDGVSVREDSGVDICKKRFNVEAKHVLDPVFLCSMSVYERLVGNSNVNNINNSDFLVSYILYPHENENYKDAVLFVSNQLNLKMVNLVEPKNSDQAIKDFNIGNSMSSTPEDFLYYIKNSKFVITNSFHAVCFAIIFRKNFICINRNPRSRFTSLLKIFGLSDRLVFCPEEISKRDDLFEEINYEKVYDVIDEKRKMSAEWLNNQIFAATDKKISTYDILDGRIDAISHKHTGLNGRIDAISQGYNVLDRRIDAISQEYAKRVDLISQEYGDLLKLMSNKNAIYWQYYKYKLLSKIIFGKKRKHYKEKRNFFHDKVRQIRTLRNLK